MLGEFDPETACNLPKKRKWEMNFRTGCSKECKKKNIVKDQNLV